MAVKISIPKKLEAELRALVDSGPVMEHHAKTVRQLIAILDDGHDTKEARAAKARAKGGMDPRDVVRKVKEILGGKVFAPPNPGTAFYSWISNRCKFLNVTMEDIERVCVHVRNGDSKHVRLPTSVEWIFKKLDALLEEEQTGEKAVQEEPQWELNLGR